MKLTPLQNHPDLLFVCKEGEGLEKIIAIFRDHWDTVDVFLILEAK